MREGYWSDKWVLVTGATGMLGSWATRRLLDEGPDVVVRIRDADPQSELLRTLPAWPAPAMTPASS